MKKTCFLLYTINCRRADCRPGKRSASALTDGALGGLENQVVHILGLTLVHLVHLAFSLTVQA